MREDAGVLDAVADRVSLRSRRHKLRLFFEFMQPDATTSVIDVGVTDSGFGGDRGAPLAENFFEGMYPWPERITAVGLGGLDHFRRAFPRVRAVTADGRDLPFGNGEFDVGFSNAVVEHVGDRGSQERFVGELCRVARRVFVTTPNRWFPIEVHTLLPVVHWLPEEPRERLYRGLGKTVGAGVRLLGPSEFRSLFPYPVRIINTGMTLIAIGGR